MERNRGVVPVDVAPRSLLRLMTWTSLTVSLGRFSSMSPGSSAIASLGWSPVLPSRMKNADAAHLHRRPERQPRIRDDFPRRGVRLVPDGAGHEHHPGSRHVSTRLPARPSELCGAGQAPPEQHCSRNHAKSRPGCRRRTSGDRKIVSVSAQTRQRLVDLGAGPQDLALTPRMHTEGAEPLSAAKVLVAGLVAMGHQVNRVDSLAGGIGCAELRRREGGKAPRRRQCGGGGNLLRLPPRSSESSYRSSRATSASTITPAGTRSPLRTGRPSSTSRTGT